MQNPQLLNDFCKFWIKIRMSFNPVLREVIGQRILHGGREAKMPSYLTPEPKFLGTPNLACGLVFTKICQEK